MSFREKWITFQNRILAALEDQTFPFGREESDEFRSYLENYDATLPAEWSPATLHEILIRAKQARAVLVGDYHTHPASANTVLWLLKQLIRLGLKPHVFLEALPDGYQKEIEAYTAGDLAEDAFLHKVGYESTFGFDWSLYRPIVQTARCSGAPVIGLNTRAAAPSLSARTGFAAAVIAEHLKKDNKAIGLVLVGEKHLAPSHLPRLIKNALSDRGIRGPIISIHRNATSAYFTLLVKGYDGAPAVFKSPSGRFLIQDASPLTQMAKDLQWFCGGSRSGRFQSDSSQNQAGPSELFGFDCEEARNTEPEYDEGELFSSVLENMAFLLALRRTKLADFHVFAGDDLNFFEQFKQDGMDRDRYAHLRSLVARRGFLYVPEYSLAYVRELVPDLLGRTSALHLATTEHKISAISPWLDAARSALGAALIDPFSAHEPLTPLHPALRGPYETEELRESPREDEGAELGCGLFQALTCEDLTVQQVQPLFSKAALADEALQSLALWLS